MIHHLPMTAHHSDPFQQFINAMFRGAGYHIGYVCAFVIAAIVAGYYLVKFVRKDRSTDPRAGRR